DAEAFQKELRDGLSKAGYIEERNVQFDIRSAQGRIDQLPKLAAELVAAKVDVLVALYTPCVRAAKQATRDIPIVAIVANPVETGIIASLARPDGNITGVSLMAAEAHGKCVEVFSDMLPSVPERETKITFAEMRAIGVRGLLIYCSDYRCSHSTAISGDRWP